MPDLYWIRVYFHNAKNYQVGSQKFTIVEIVSFVYLEFPLTGRGTCSHCVLGGSLFGLDPNVI